MIVDSKTVSPGYSPIPDNRSAQTVMPGEARAHSQAAGIATDRVELTATVQTLQKAAELAASEPVVNRERVDRIREAIQAGEYDGGFRRTAEKFLQFETVLQRLG